MDLTRHIHQAFTQYNESLAKHEFKLALKARQVPQWMFTIYDDLVLDFKTVGFGEIWSTITNPFFDCDEDVHGFDYGRDEIDGPGQLDGPDMGDGNSELGYI